MADNSPGTSLRVLQFSPAAATPSDASTLVEAPGLPPPSQHPLGWKAGPCLGQARQVTLPNHLGDLLAEVSKLFLGVGTLAMVMPVMLLSGLKSSVPTR